MCLRYPGTRWFIGRDELKKVRDSWLPTWYKVVRFYGLIPKEWFKYQGQDHYILFENGSRIDLIDLKYEPSDPFYERYGSIEYTGGAIEEAGEVDFNAFDTLKSRIGRCLNDKYNITPKILLTCNPKKNFLYTDFYKPWKDGTLPKDKAFVQATIDDNEFAESSVREQLDGITDKTKKERLRHGEWEYSEDAGALITMDAITDAFSGKVDGAVPGNDRYITADIARHGSDNTVIVVWSGLRAERIFVYQDLSVTQSAEKIRDLQQQHNISVRNVIVDEDGVGGGVVDTLACEGFINNSRPIETSDNTANFSNLKSQCYYTLAQLMNERKIFINCTNNDVKSRLIEELEQVRLKDVDSDGKVAIVSKKEVKERIGRSPDIADAIMLRMKYELRPTPGAPIMTFHHLGTGTFHGNTGGHSRRTRHEVQQSAYDQTMSRINDIIKGKI